MARTKTNKESTVNTDTPNFDTTTAPEAPADFDVDAPVVATEDTVEAAPTEGEKPAKEKKESTRPPVPEGKVSPVQFAKILTEHLREQGRLDADKAVAPQVVYSYIKNNGPESKNPFPATKAEGRAAVVDADEAIKWWDAKDERVQASKTAAAEKAAKKAEKATAAPETPTEVTEAPALVEAE
jgi:hypothetical protein